VVVTDALTPLGRRQPIRVRNTGGSGLLAQCGTAFPPDRHPFGFTPTVRFPDARPTTAKPW
jgi:hypothetical protein